MAAALFTVAGSAFGGPLGGMVGNVLGNLVDNALFPQPNPIRRIQVSTYGTCIPIGYGPWVPRFAGNVIWWSGLHNAPKTGAKKALEIFAPLTSLLLSSTKSPQYAHVAVALLDRTTQKPIIGVRNIWANSKAIFSADGAPGPHYSKGDGAFISQGVFTDLTVYPGSFTQMPDPTIESIVTQPVVSAYRGIAYVVIQNLNFAAFGNVLPNLEFLVESEDEMSVASVLVDLATRAGIDPNTVSTSGLESKALMGYVIGESTTATGAAKTLAGVYNFDNTDQGGGLRFVPRGGMPRGLIYADDLAVQAPGEKRPEPLHWSRDRETILPKQVALIYCDPANVYNPMSQTAIRASGFSDSNIQLQVAVTLTTTEGMGVATTMLWNAWNGRDKAKGMVSDRWIKSLQAGYLYTVDTPGGYENLRITTVTRGANGVIEFECERDVALVYEQVLPGVAIGNYTLPVEITGPTTMQLIDGPILQDSDDNAGFYATVDGVDAGWTAASLARSTDGGDTFTTIGMVAASSALGNLTNTLGVGPAGFFDRTNTIEVTTDSELNTFATVTELDVMNGANGLWIGSVSGNGGEIVQFATAEQTGNSTWVLSDLLRGRLGTEWAIGNHAAGERLASLSQLGTVRLNLGAADLNNQWPYEAVSVGEVATDIPTEDFTNTGEGLRCLSPVHPAGTRDGDNDLTLTWFRRSRYQQPGLGNGLLPLGEELESYSIDVLDGMTVLGTFAVQGPFPGLPTLVLSAGQQTAMGITPGDAVSGAVYQINATRGRGHPCPFTV